MNTQKGFSTLLGILLAIVILGGGTYFYTMIKTDLKSGDDAKFIGITEKNAVTTLSFDPGYSIDTLVSPDNSRNARITGDGKIFITSKGFVRNSEIVIDVLNGSTTIPGFSVSDYKQRRGDGYISKSYYNGIFAFIGNNRILYPVSDTQSMIKDLKTGEVQEISGDVVTVLNTTFLVYSQDSKDSVGIDNQYVLYNIIEKTETIFFPDARKDFASLSQFVLCNNELGFVQYFRNNPNSEEDNKHVYFKFDTISSKLTKIGESAGMINPSEEYISKLNSCN